MKAFIAMALLVLGGMLAGCEGPRGPEGPPGETGDIPGTDAGISTFISGPGLQLEFSEPQITDQTATVNFRITDQAGVPLSREGGPNQLPVSISFVLARLEQGPEGTYTALTLRPQTAPDGGRTEIQPSADQGGTFEELAPGTYRYTFGTPVQVVDANRIYSIGAWATRMVGDVRYVENEVLHFTPSGSDVDVTRQVVLTENCNQCHMPLQAHGGARREVALCILCHTPQAVDPDTGNTVDFPVMVHKIHMGEELPSVQAGEPYRIIGFRQSVNDYSEVKYPQDITRCETCHEGAAQGLAWQTRPTRSSCGSCHDRISFVAPPPPGFRVHTGGPQPDDSLCATCHPQSGGIAGVVDSHLSPERDPASPEVGLELLDVQNVSPGASPIITFRVTVDEQPRDILMNRLNRLAVTFAGPTAPDYQSFTTVTMQGTGAIGTVVAQDAANGVFRFEVPATVAIPAEAVGTWAFALEGYLQPAGPTGPRFAAFNPVRYAAVAGGAPRPRREVVETERCDRCHFELEAHGGQRRNTEYCVMCHNPNFANIERSPRVQGTTVTAQSLHLKVMIHKIHTGEELSQQPYLLGGFPAPTAANPRGTQINFGTVRYPGDRRNCEACHVPRSYLLPLPPGVLPSREVDLRCTDPGNEQDRLCTTREISATRFTPPVTAACNSCHDSPAAQAHAATMTAGGVEACNTCHATGREQAVERVHQPPP